MNNLSQIYTVTGLIDITPENPLLKPETVFEDEAVNWEHFNPWLYERELIRISEPIIQDTLSQLPKSTECYYLTGSARFIEQKGAKTLQFQVAADTHLSEDDYNKFLRTALSPILNDEFGPVYKALEELAYNHLPDKFCRDVQVRYRTESFSGLQERDAAEVMAFETFELGNTDILECLRDTLLKGLPICEKIQLFIDEINQNGYVDDMSSDDKVDFFRDVLKEVFTATGIQVNHALWLADKDTVLNFYGKDMSDEKDYDAYEVGPIVLSDLGYDGTLYGYADMPVPLEEYEISLIENCSAPATSPPPLSSQIFSAETRIDPPGSPDNAPNKTLER